MERKMHCAPQTKGNDSPKVSEAGKNFKSAKHQQQNKVTSLDITTKHSQESSLSRINSDSRCAILTFLSFEPDGTWRILAVPVQCLNHVNLASGVTMDGLQLLFPPPLNRPKIDQCKGTRGQVPSSAYSVKQSYARRSFTNSNVRRRCQNKVANKVACKLNELPADSCAQSSLVGSSSPSLSTHSNDVVISSDMCLSNTKEDKSLKKNSRKRTRKKVRQIKKQSSVDNGSTEREVHTEDFVCASLTSETCSSNDVDTNAPESSSSDDRSMKIDCERNEMNDKINVRDAPKRCESRVDEAVVNKETKDIQHVELCCFNEIQDSLVLDAVSIDSKSDESINGVHIGKPSNKASCGITSNSGDEYFLGQGLTNGGQNCVGNDKKVQQKRTMSKSSSFNKFAGVGIGRTGKENSHSVWQKVQKNGSSKCGGGDLKKVNTASSQFVSSTTEKDPSAIKNCNSVSANVVSGLDDKKHVKNKVGRKSKGKSESVPKKGHCNYSKKGSNFNRAVLNDNLKVTIQQNDSSSFSSQEVNQQESVIEFQTDGVEHESSEIVHREQFNPDEPDIQKSLLETKNESIDIQDSSLAMLGENIGQSDMSDELSQVGQTVKEVSSGSTQWKWIPVGKKDNGMSKSESNSSSSEDSDEPSSKIFDLENGVEPKMDSFSLNHQDSTYTGQIDDKASSCVGEGENHKTVEVNAEHRDKHEVANHMIYEFENQDMIENDSYRIARAVSDACRVQLACEVVYKATGGPVAEFERLLHFSSPVICRSPNSLGCLTCAPDHSGDVSLCRHEVPAVSLGCLWQWYEKHGSYGLEIRAWDYEIPRTVGGGGHFPFRAYFVPSLSAVQLFKNHENQHVNNSEARRRFDNSEDSTFSGDLELLFEYFECEQPQQRRPLYERIQELIRGDIPFQSKTYGDSTKLDSINLQDIHPRSWYSVAWYPIYRIPDGNFRASFLTYHSLGHMVRRSSNSDSPSLDSCIVSPAVGLQSYNAKGECWFQMNNFAVTAEMLGINSSLFLKERLRTLEETASIMARAVVNKGNQISTNSHPDYEFFLSRQRY